MLIYLASNNLLVMIAIKTNLANLAHEDGSSLRCRHNELELETLIFLGVWIGKVRNTLPIN